MDWIKIKSFHKTCSLFIGKVVNRIKIDTYKDFKNEVSTGNILSN